MTRTIRCVTVYHHVNTAVVSQNRVFRREPKSILPATKVYNIRCTHLWMNPPDDSLHIDFRPCKVCSSNTVTFLNSDFGLYLILRTATLPSILPVGCLRQHGNFTRFWIQCLLSIVFKNKKNSRRCNDLYAADVRETEIDCESDERRVRL